MRTAAVPGRTPMRRVGASGAALGVSSAARMFTAAAIFIVISRLQGTLTFLVTIRASLVFSVIGLALLLGSTRRWMPGDLRRHWIPKLVGLIALIATIGIPFGIYPGQSLTFMNEGFSRTLLLALMAWAVARTEDGTRFMVHVVAAAGMTAGILALIKGRTDIAGRLAGANTYDPNDLALVLVMSIPLAVFWALDKTSKLRIVGLAGIPVMALVIFKTGSRGGFFALTTAVLGFFVQSFARGASPALKRTSMAVVAAGVVAFFFLPAQYKGLIASAFGQEDYNRDSSTGRLAIWKRGLGYAVDHPLTGVGISSFRTAEGRLSDLAAETGGVGLKWSAAHNSFVQITAELGFIAGAAFIVLVGRTVFALLFQKAPPGRKQEPIQPILGISFMAFLVGGFFLSFAYTDILYILFGLAAAVLIRAAPRPGSPLSREMRRSGAVQARPSTPG
jgi:O-antigen ligase